MHGRGGRTGDEGRPEHGATYKAGGSAGRTRAAITAAERADEIHQEEMKNLQEELNAVKKQLSDSEKNLENLNNSMRESVMNNHSEETATVEGSDTTTSEQQQQHHPTSTTFTKTKVIQNTKRSALDIAEINRLRKDNDFLKQKIDQLTKDLNEAARKSLNSAFNSTKSLSFSWMVASRSTHCSVTAMRRR